MIKLGNLYREPPREYNGPVKKNGGKRRRKVRKMDLYGLIDADILEKATELRHELHSMAELSGREANTKRRLMTFLEENTSLELIDRGSWFYAAYRSKNASDGKKRIAFRADTDALPIDEGTALTYASKTRGVSHKCGHDGHMATLCAFALTADRCGCENDLFFLFQPAEETGEGAAECESLIADENIGEIFGYHNMPGFPLGSVAVHTGCAACASTGLVFRFIGKNSHASQPENGCNPSFAIAKLISDIPSAVREAAGGSVREIVPGAVMSADGIVMCTVVGASSGSRTDGTGEAFGTSAGFGRLSLTIRAENEKRMDLLEKLLGDEAEALAAENSLAVSVERVEPFPETRNDAASAEKVRAAAAALGLPPAEWNEPFRSSEDFGRYTKLTAGALFYLGCGEEHAPLHTACYDFPDALIAAGAAVFAKLGGVCRKRKKNVE